MSFFPARGSSQCSTNLLAASEGQVEAGKEMEGGKEGKRKVRKGTK